jgi:hypothetical protein
VLELARPCGRSGLIGPVVPPFKQSLQALSCCSGDKGRGGLWLSVFVFGCFARLAQVWMRFSHAQVFSRDPLDLKPRESLNKAMNDFQPDSVLTITRTSGQVVISQGGNNANFDVMLRYSTVIPKAEFWTAKTDVRVLTANLFTNDKKTGEKVGAQFVDLMKNDGVVCSGRASN